MCPHENHSYRPKVMELFAEGTMICTLCGQLAIMHPYASLEELYRVLGRK